MERVGMICSKKTYKNNKNTLLKEGVFLKFKDMKTKKNKPEITPKKVIIGFVVVIIIAAALAVLV